MFLSPLVVVFCIDGIKYELASRVCLTFCLTLPFVPLLDISVILMFVSHPALLIPLSDDKDARSARGLPGV